MNKKKLITLIIVLLVAVILVVVILMNPKTPTKPQTEKNNVTPVANLDNSSESESSNTLSGKTELITGDESVEVFSEVLDVTPIIAEAPREDILENSKQELKTVNLAISETGFSPKTFTVKTGQVITLNLGVTDENTHAFNFTNVELIASDVTVTAGYSLGFNIVAPLEAGTYTFHDALFPENTGKMIVE